MNRWDRSLIRRGTRGADANGHLEPKRKTRPGAAFESQRIDREGWPGGCFPRETYTQFVMAHQ